MKTLVDAQELARRFNEEEAVWQLFEQKRRMRDSTSALPNEILDEIDWREAERECRQTRCVGRLLDGAT